MIVDRLVLKAIHMSILREQQFQLFLMDQTVWMLTRPTGLGVYDFPFKRFFDCQHPWQRPDKVQAIARIGAIDNYEGLYDGLMEEGIQLIHSPDEYERCSELPNWYPLIEDMTPKSIWFDGIPDVEDIMQHFDFPIFIKGSRQTSKHQRNLSIIENEPALAHTLEQYQNDPILHWQQLVCREYVQLRSVSGGKAETIPASYEFRTFWWQGQYVGGSAYWTDVEAYQWTESEKADALALAEETAQRVDVPFLVVDVAQRVDGQWIVIECNDGQESGYASVPPLKLWKAILKSQQ